MKRSSHRFTSSQLKDFLEEKTDLYNRPEFISSDPISVPHRFSLKEDIEISAFFAATFAWGKRAAIIAKTSRLMELMGNSPYDFVMSAKTKELNRLNNFVHRTFNASDAKEFIRVIKKIYESGGMQKILASESNAYNRINLLHDIFARELKTPRTLKHVSSPARGSAAKRINMFLRWMVRNDKRGVDFGLWKDIKPSTLICPLDVHSGNVARKLGLLTRRQNDWQAATELTDNLIKMDKKDPVKYDFALFGLGVFERF